MANRPLASAPGSIDIRPPLDDELRAACEMLCVALVAPRPDDEAWTRAEPSYRECDAVAAFDGPRCVGYAATFVTDTVVPGGARLPTAAVTRVGVLPTHTRRGLLRTMLGTLLTASRDRGHALASLRASEGGIYGRFGFGVAGEHAVGVLRPEAARPIRDPADGSMQLLATDEILDVVPECYERAARRRVGTIARTEPTWTRLLRQATEPGDTASHVAVHRDAAGLADGYVHYDLRWPDEHDMTSMAAGTVHDLFGVDDAVERALWAYLVDLDLVEHWDLPFRPVDDAVRWAVADTRAYVTARRNDEQWVRLLDVHLALGRRSYGPGPTVTVEVTHDVQFDDNVGRYTIDESGEVRRGTGSPADVRVDVSTLGAAYLGGTSWHELAAAGLVDHAGDAAVDRVEARFAHRPLPFCGTFF